MLVGQDYRRLSRHCAWAKPMTYRVALGPAGLRLEIPALIEGVTRLSAPMRRKSRSGPLATSGALTRIR